ncbi:MAG: hypothetical protein KKD29_07190, partial [Candidatus Omnitrophica bacterium]|nr:hypothetical protein [Candidatus Omnitrophota bacterium]
GTEIQPYISAFLADHFKKQGLINYAIAKDKNQFPDFTLKTSPELAIEYKCGNVVELKDKKWIKCKNSENDMGTLNMWEKKLKQFGGDNIYYLFVIYHFDDTIKKIVEVQIDLFYKFLALNKDGALRYREKDGNLRPKDFYADSPITTLEQFEDLRSGTDVYRSRRIIKKHIKHIPKKDRKKFLKELS